MDDDDIRKHSYLVTQSNIPMQMWVVDSSPVGLQSVQYYTEAAQFATH